MAQILQEGDEGKEVEYIQQMLANHGKQGTVPGCDPGIIDGIFGPQTKEAVMALQRKMGLEVDGIVGPQTGRYLAETYWEESK